MSGSQLTVLASEALRTTRIATTRLRALAIEMTWLIAVVADTASAIAALTRLAWLTAVARDVVGLSAVEAGAIATTSTALTRLAWLIAVAGDVASCKGVSLRKDENQGATYLDRSCSKNDRHPHHGASAPDRSRETCGQLREVSDALSVVRRKETHVCRSCSSCHLHLQHSVGSQPCDDQLRRS